MGKKFNKRARQDESVIINKSPEENVKIEFSQDIDEYTKYDDANALVLPSKKRETIKQREKHVTTRILSKRKRKQLEKVVDKKKKKEGRQALLEALSAVQVSNDELKQYTTLSEVQTLGSKNLIKLDTLLKRKHEEKTIDDDDGKTARISSIKGMRKRRMALLKDGGDSDVSEDEVPEKEKKRNYNIVGLDPDTDDEEEEEETSNNKLPENNAYESSTVQNNDVDLNTSHPIEENTHINSGWTEEYISGQSLINDSKTNSQSQGWIETPITVKRKETVFVPVYRDPEIQETRLKLPILAEEQLIMETISENAITILAGETGSGKTTQVPQFLYEAGFTEKKMIGITEPRRVAAISMSKRVSKEMNLSEKEVSYLIRFEGNVTDKTQIKFMTDGVLLKEIEADYLLSKYSVIILDEAHERSSYTDILIGLLSRIVPLRTKKGSPLKLIIMSATLRVQDFTGNQNLFKNPPPVLNIEARQYPVTVHFQKKTAQDYIKEAYRKVVKIHSRLPEGGILVFLTGQQEVNYLVRKLRKQFPYISPDEKNIKNSRRNAEKGSVDVDNRDEWDLKKALKNAKKAKARFAQQMSLPKINLDNYTLPTDDTDADLLDNYDDEDEFLLDSENDEDNDLDDLDSENTVLTKQPLWVLPLYSILSTEKQNRVFESPPPGCRLCIVSTNVAETSLTIPNIKYVVDTGRQKSKLYDKVTGVSTFVVTFTSKASADQRAGRAGRTSAGHCYRLYSSAVFTDEFIDFETPDIQKKPIDDLMLQMQNMGICKVVSFPFPSPPDTTQLQAAEDRLILLGALEKVSDKRNEKVTKITALGRAISTYPVSPRFGKMLALSHQQGLLPYVVCLVAALSVQEVLLEVSLDAENSAEGNKSSWYHKRKRWAGSGHFELLGDPMVLLRAVGGAEYAGFEGKLSEFCEAHGLREKAVTEIRKLRKQITNEINLNTPGLGLFVDPQMKPPTDIQAKFLRQILLAGMGDRIARKVQDYEIKDKETRRKFKYAYKTPDMEDPVFLHSSSVLKRKQPEWVVYQDAFELQIGDSRKTFIRGITAIEPEWLLLFVPQLCNIKNILDEPQPKYNSKDGKVYCFVKATFGRAGFEIPLAEVEMPMSEQACRYFGMYFLNGDVCPKLQEFKDKLKSTPSSLIKSWSKTNQILSNFILAIINKQVNSKKQLLDIWNVQPNYLLEEYFALLQDVEHSTLSNIWPPKS